MTFLGYVITPAREDYRVSLDGMECNGDCSDRAIADFQAIAYIADEIKIYPNYLLPCWD